ncbi:MAG: hypothetical protein AAF382_15825 [Pseudomonadota bacterium]
MTKKFFDYDEGSHFLSCLNLIDANLRVTEKDETNLRWIIVGLHDALYALLIEKLVKTDGFGIYPDTFEKEVRSFYSKGHSSGSREYRRLNERSVKRNIAGLPELLSRANLKSGAKIVHTGFSACDQPTRGLSKLKQMRNFFSHPRPGLNAYDRTFVSEAVRSTIEVIEELRGLSSNARPRHNSADAEVLMISIRTRAETWLGEGGG